MGGNGQAPHRSRYACSSADSILDLNARERCLASKSKVSILALSKIDREVTHAPVTVVYQRQVELIVAMVGAPVLRSLQAAAKLAPRELGVKGGRLAADTTLGIGKRSMRR